MRFHVAPRSSLRSTPLTVPAKIVPSSDGANANERNRDPALPTRVQLPGVAGVLRAEHVALAGAEEQLVPTRVVRRDPEDVLAQQLVGGARPTWIDAHSPPRSVDLRNAVQPAEKIVWSRA